MMSWPRSGSSGDPPSSDGRSSASFDLLDERVRRWIWEQGWSELRDIQEEAIRSVVERRSDLIIASATASGKTEAAFLPICSELLAGEKRPGIRTLYVSPLKALINDQFRRMEDLCKELRIPVHRWHGDVPSGRKRRLVERPSGVLLITPESLEALFVNHGHRMPTFFAALEWVVVDELHAFVDTDRGRQLQSLLHRLELCLARPLPRVGLSATLGDMLLAAEYLRPGGAEDVETIVSSVAGQEIRLQIRGYVSRKNGSEGSSDSVPEAGEPTDVEQIADHLFSTLRGADHLVFANSRGAVEEYADRLRRRSESERLPNEFFPHHGNLSRELREDLETRLKDPTRPATAICTSTLELGIDIGQVSSIGQIGAPFSVSSLRQRLGRSGRRGEAATLRFYIRESEITPRCHTLDRLRIELVQAVAMVELLIERWCEPPTEGALHLSPLIQQVLSLIAERGGITAQEGWGALCRSGPFGAVDASRFAALLRSMGAQDLLVQSEDGTLLFGEKGERIANHFSFYTIFQTPEEFQVLDRGRPLGTLSIDYLMAEGLHIIFAGRRWRVVSVDPEQKALSVVPSPGGSVPGFVGGSGGPIHDRVRRKMRDVWEGAALPRYLDPEARKLLDEGRSNYVRLGLEARHLVGSGKDTILFLCRGDTITNTVALQLLACGLKVSVEGPAIVVDGTGPAEVRTVLIELVREGPADSTALAAQAGNKRAGKYDWVLDDELLEADYASWALDTGGAYLALRELLEPERQPTKMCPTFEQVVDEVLSLSSDRPLPRRTVVVPNSRVSHALRRAILNRGRPDLLVGTRFLTPRVLALVILRDANVEFAEGEEVLRPARLAKSFDDGPSIPHFGSVVRADGRGWESAFARAIGELESAGLRPSELRALREDKCDGVATVWEATNESAGRSWTTARLIAEAARKLESDSELWSQAGPVIGVVTDFTDEGTLRLLRAVPSMQFLLRAGRPLRRRRRERIEHRFGITPGREPMSALLAQPRRDRDLLVSRFMEGLESASDVSPAASGPADGSLEVEEFPGIDEEVEAAVAWVSQQILERTTPLHEIALLAPRSQPYAHLLYDRLLELPGRVPTYVAGGLPVAATASGRRLSILIRALKSFLSPDAVATVLPLLKAGSRKRSLTSSAAVEVAYSLGTVGGSTSDPSGALQWSDRAAISEARLSKELDQLAKEETDESKRARGVHEMERILRHLRACRPALDELVALQSHIIEHTPLREFWPELTAFVENRLRDLGGNSCLPSTVRVIVERALSDPVCAELSGGHLLSFLEQTLLSNRCPIGTFGDPAVYVGTISSAVGLPFRAVRVLGLVEGSVPLAPAEDPILSDDLRAAFGRDLETSEDLVARSLGELDLVLRDTAEYISFSAPRLASDRVEKAHSAVFLETAAALRRQLPGRRPQTISDCLAGEIAGTRARRSAFQTSSPLGEAGWQRRVAGGGTPPASWSRNQLIDPRAIRSLEPSSVAIALDGFLGTDSELPLLPGLSQSRPLSASRFRTFLECPHRFLLEHVFGWREPPSSRPLTELDALAYGGLVHRVSERFFSEHGTGFCARQATLAHWIAAARAAAETEFDLTVEIYPLAGEGVRAEQLSRLLRDFSRFLESEWNERGPATFHSTERAFGWHEPVSLSTGSSEVFVHGYIDLIDTADSTTWVRDLKTGKARPRTGRNCDPLPEHDAQVGLYLRAAQQLAQGWQLPPRFVAGYVHTDERRGRQRLFDADVDQLTEATNAWLELAVQLQQQGSFPRTTREEDCHYCPFRPVCGPWAYERASSLLESESEALADFRDLKANR